MCLTSRAIGAKQIDCCIVLTPERPSCLCQECLCTQGIRTTWGCWVERWGVVAVEGFMCPSFGQLSLIWDLQVTLCPHTRPLTQWSLWSETEGLFLVIRQPAAGHAQSIMAFHIMYRSTQTPIPTSPHSSAFIPIPLPHTSRRSRLSNKSHSNEDIHSF